MRFLAFLAGLIGGYLAGVGIGAGLISLVSTNTHDRSVEMATTAALVTGPIGALIGGFIAMRWRRRRSAS